MRIRSFRRTLSENAGGAPLAPDGTGERPPMAHGEFDTPSCARPLNLEPHEWTDYFGAIAVDGDRMLATVGLPGQDPSTSHDLHQRLLRSISYDRGEDLLMLAVGGAARSPSLRYYVVAPRTITVAESGHGREILVGDCSGVQTLIVLFDLCGAAGVPAGDLAGRPEGVALEG